MGPLFGDQVPKGDFFQKMGPQSPQKSRGLLMDIKNFSLSAENAISKSFRGSKIQNSKLDPAWGPYSAPQTPKLDSPRWIHLASLGFSLRSSQGK